MLALITFYKTGDETIIYRLLSCVIYTIIKNYVCIDYLSCQWKQISTLPVCSGGGSIHESNRFDKILGIGISILLMNLMSCHGF